MAPTIAVFDSGFGGLTVLRELLPMMPGAHFLYLGDTARLPYGAKSQKTIARYAVSSGAFLLAQGAEMLVVACNTASAVALDDLRKALPIPVIGVIDPGTKAAAEVAGQTDREAASVLVLATAATVQSHAYRASCARLGIRAFEKACPLLVPLVEEGWIEHPVTAEVLRIYLGEALEEAPDVETLVLGCTHYPLLAPVMEWTLRELGKPLKIVDSASATARAAAAMVSYKASVGRTTCSFYATDSIEKFRQLGSAFLGHALPEVQLVDLGG